MLQNNSQNSSKKFICELCHYTCSKKNDMTKHESSQKHKCNTEGNNCNPQFVKNEMKCNLCDKLYKSRVGLWRHKKTCTFVKPVEEKNPMEMAFLTNLVMEVVKNNSDLQKQNQELQKKMLDVCAAGGGNTNNSHNNSYNKTFNMQFFLNETCKDAMNIMDFVNSMTLEFSDLEDVGKLGYVEGISNIIIRKLNALDIHKRPIHCSDAKREIMYVKDENVWEKENSTYDKLRKAIKHITCKNSSLLVPWSKEHPQCMNNQHHLNDVYVQMMGQAMGGKESFMDSENKIMKKIAKAVLIEKN